MRCDHVEKSNGISKKKSKEWVLERRGKIKRL